MLYHGTHRSREVRLALAAAMSAVLVFGVAAGRPAHAEVRCTHGASSIGPVVLHDGRIVGGDATPHTEACLP